MAKINSFEMLKKLNGEYKEKYFFTPNENIQNNPVQVKVALATCGIASGAKSILEYFSDELAKRNIDAVVSKTGCMGYCYAEPTVEVTLPGEPPLVFGHVNKLKADEIIEKYIKNGDLVDGIIPVMFQSID